MQAEQVEESEQVEHPLEQAWHRAWLTLVPLKYPEAHVKHTLESWHVAQELSHVEHNP